MELPGTYREDTFKEEYENALVLKKCWTSIEFISKKQEGDDVIEKKSRFINRRKI